MPSQFADIAQRAKQVVWNQLLTQLRTEMLDELRWYFEQLRAHPTPSRSNDLDERFYEARDAFSAPRFGVLYRAWKPDGEAVLASAGCRAISDAVNAGAGRVETLELGHRYGHLSPWLPSPDRHLLAPYTGRASLGNRRSRPHLHRRSTRRTLTVERE